MEHNLKVNAVQPTGWHNPTAEEFKSFFAMHRGTTTRNNSTCSEEQASIRGSNVVDPFQQLYKAVKTAMCDTQAFVRSLGKTFENRKKNAPLPIVAVANEITRDRATSQWFPTFSMELKLPHMQEETCMSPAYHSISGSSLFLVDWEAHFPSLKLCCPFASCKGKLKADRTNWSKHKSLFPMFRMDGQPSYCIVMQYQCSSCKTKLNANDAKLLISLPEHVRCMYPVDLRFADNTHTFHLHKDCSALMEDLIPTYGNGDMVARIFYSRIVNCHKEKLAQYLTCWGSILQSSPSDNRPLVPTYPQLHGEFICHYPPVGETLREMFDKACNSKCTPYGISDHDRHTREIQSVGCASLFAMDHTHEVVKNYQTRKAIGAFACFDVANENGEIATAVLVPSTQAKHVAHAAQCLARRPNFKPKAMYYDTFPKGECFWKLVFHNVGGRLGLFHFMQRIVRALRQNHVDYYKGVSKLCEAIYRWDDEPYEALLLVRAL